MVLEAWAKAGYTLVPVHPAAAEIAGRPVFASLVEAARDAPVDGALVLVPAHQADAVVADAVAAGVPRVWLHQGAGPGAVSAAAVRRATAADLDLVVGECALMYVAGTGFIHRVHRFFHRPKATLEAPA